MKRTMGKFVILVLLLVISTLTGCYVSPSGMVYSGCYESILPCANATYDLGSVTNYWKDIYVTNIHGAVTGGGVTGAGTLNWIPKFTGASSIGNSALFDDGIAIATTIPITTTSTVDGVDISAHAAATTSVHNFDTVGNAPPQVNIRKQIWLWSDMWGSSSQDLNNPWTGQGGIVSGTIAARVGQTNHPGIVRISSAVGANSGYRLTGYTSFDQFLISGGEQAECILSIVTTANTTIRFGYADSWGAVDAADGVYFEYSAGVLQGKTATNSVRSTTGTTYAAVAATWYRLHIVVNGAANLVTYYIYDNTGAVLWTDTLAANIPTAAGRETSFGIMAISSSVAITPLTDIDAMAFYNYAVMR